ncbi:MAG: hypothetical protein ABIJ53_06685 [Verrucomicrobiota bacterium]
MSTIIFNYFYWGGYGAVYAEMARRHAQRRAVEGLPDKGDNKENHGFPIQSGMTSTRTHSVIPVKTGIQNMCYIETPWHQVIINMLITAC